MTETPTWHATAIVLLALSLLAMTLSWHVPMMLWDHLDLVPLVQQLRDGEIGREFWQLHGGHWHSAAYVLLLITTSASNATAWLDCVVSWLLLVCYAGVIGWMVRDARQHGRASASSWWLLVMALALYPGHLSNLQWGWQVAVFLCLLGVATSVLLLTRQNFSWRHNAGAITAGLIALTSFATAIALVPTALVLIALRADQSRVHRCAFAAPWIALGVATLIYYRGLALHVPTIEAGASVTLHYVLNFLGGGIARFATAVAPVLAVMALLIACKLLPTARRDRHCLPWLGFLLFAGFSAIAVALGRAGSFGAEHAFVSRYVSFSSMFWLGWIGLLLTVREGAAARWEAITLSVVLAFATLNAIQLIGKAAKLATSTRETAESIRSSYPRVDQAILRSIYFDQPDVAHERLRMLHRWGYPPFSEDTIHKPD